MANIIKQIYEIQDIGKGVIDSITEDNLLLLIDSSQGVQGIENVLATNNVLTSGTFNIALDQGSSFGALSETVSHLTGIFNVANIGNLAPNIILANFGRIQNSNFSGLRVWDNKMQIVDQLLKGLEYPADYSSNFTAHSLITKQYADSLVGTTYSAGTGLSLVGTTFNNTAPDQTVSLTQAGATTITGTYPNFTISSTNTNTTYSAGIGLELVGTTFNIVNLQKPITGNYIVLATDNNYSIKINNGSTPITITVPAGLPANFFAGFTQKGTGDVTFLGTGGVSITNPIGLKIKGQGYCVGLEQIGTSNIFDLLADTKA